MYARNLLNFLKPAIEKGELTIDWSDEVFAQSCLTHDGVVKHEPTPQDSLRRLSIKHGRFR